MGGGPAGAAAAAGGAAAGLRAVVLAGAPDGRRRPGESLPPGGEAVLREVFGEGGFRGERHRVARGARSVWGGEGVEEAEFFGSNPFGSGWHLDRAAFEADLLAAVAARGVRVAAGARVVSVERVGGAWELAAGDSRLRARLLIDATGRSARVARRLGAARRRLDGLVAVVWEARAEGGDDADGATTVEAVEEGWWYTTPLPDRRRVVAWLTDADLLPPPAARAAATPPPVVGELLDRHGYERMAPPRVTDASASHLDRLGGDGWLATGDAAACFDPLSSQGILTAVTMGREAAVALATGADAPAAYAARYERLLAEHLSARADYYDEERRWPDAPFWRRRQVS